MYIYTDTHHAQTQRNDKTNVSSTNTRTHATHTTKEIALRSVTRNNEHYECTLADTLTPDACTRTDGMHRFFSPWSSVFRVSLPLSRRITFAKKLNPAPIPFFHAYGEKGSWNFRDSKTTSDKRISKDERSRQSPFEVLSTIFRNGSPGLEIAVSRNNVVAVIDRSSRPLVAERGR